jgi:hypothetical protein
MVFSVVKPFQSSSTVSWAWQTQEDLMAYFPVLLLDHHVKKLPQNQSK